MEEFRTLVSQIGVYISEPDMKKVFELIDLQQIGKISYNDFCDVMERSQEPPIEMIVRKRMKDRGQNFIEGLQEQPSMSLGLKTTGGERGEGSQIKDIGSVDGLSALMKRS